MKTLAIGNTANVAVKFSLKDGGINKPFSFNFTAKKYSQDEVTELLSEKDNKVTGFMRDVVTGWSGQRLVLDDNGEPSAFDAEALDMMLNVMGVANVMFGAYFKECAAKEKN